MSSNGEIVQGVGTSAQANIMTLSASTSSHDGDSITLRASSVNHSSSALELGELIYPTSPSSTQRYKLPRTVKDKPPTCLLKPLSISPEDKEQLPQDWQRFVHPEGLPYFCLSPSQNGDRPMRIITEEWIIDYDTRRAIEDFTQQIQDFILRFNVLIPEMSDLFLELYRGDPGDKWMCGYYFVHHPTRSVYWLEDVELEHQSEPLKEVRGEISGYQTKTCLEVEYWTYWDSFPTIQTMTSEVHEYVVDILVSAMTDVVSSRTSTITRTYETLQNMLNIVIISKDIKTSNWHIGRFMKEAVLDRLRNYHGAQGARLSRDQGVLECTQPVKRSKFLLIASPFLFFIPHAQLRRVDPLVVDRTVITIHWDKFFQELQEEWNQTMTVATIMLAANCAYLAIPMFQSSSDVPDTHSTPEQVASYLSLVSSLFSLILGMVMYRQHQTNRPSTAAQILAYIFNSSGADSGLVRRIEHLVLIWSFPHALLLWSVVTFLLAFLIMCFSGTHTYAKVLIALSTGFLDLLVFYYILRFGSGKKVRLRWRGRFSRGFRGLWGLIQRATKGLRRKPREEDSKVAGAV